MRAILLRRIRGIARRDAHQIPRNAHVVVRNPNKTSPGRRRLLVGRADGWRGLTLVIGRLCCDTVAMIPRGSQVLVGTAPDLAPASAPGDAAAVGGAALVPEVVRRYVEAEARSTGRSAANLVRSSASHDRHG